MNHRNGNRWSGWDQGSRIPVNNRVPFSSFRQSSDARSGATTRIGRFEESPVDRLNANNNTRFPTMQIVLFDSITRKTRPRMEPFPLFSGLLQRNSLNLQSREDSSKVENEKALKMLKKVTYGSDPKNLTRRLSLFYNGVAGSSNATLKGNNIEELNEDSKRCAICLDDFEIGTQVMVTPCNHMFHEDCILPWMKSKGQCPVCRFVIPEQVKANTSATPVMPLYDDLFAVEDAPLIIRTRVPSIIRPPEHSNYVSDSDHLLIEAMIELLIYRKALRDRLVSISEYQVYEY